MDKGHKRAFITFIDGFWNSLIHDSTHVKHMPKFAKVLFHGQESVISPSESIISKNQQGNLQFFMFFPAQGTASK